MNHPTGRLGRKSCPPTGPLAGGLETGSLEKAFAGRQLLPGPDDTVAQRGPWAWLEAPADEPGARRVDDQPVGFHPDRREYGHRWEVRRRITIDPNATEWEDIW
ncbi:hypothetical protein ACFVVL_30080 [Kitasatospora sp. NPDC058115]|uniref:hypothetical protein n=1 Tax=Kitasatospora sp. NPDC058115 TaxID=3346347 RepID=UPI0036DD397C